MNNVVSFESRSDRLIGWSPSRAKKRGAEKQAHVLNWLYHWGYGSASTIVAASGAEDRGYTQRLVRAGLIRPVPTTRCPTTATIFVLTRDGLEQARSQTEVHLDYPELDSRRVNQVNVRHNLIAQRELLARLPEFHSWRSDRDFGQNMPEAKRPDGGLVDTLGHVLGIEIELTGKWGRRLDQLAIRMVVSIAQEKFAGFLVLCASNNMIERYRAVLAPGHQIRKWEQIGSKWVQRGCYYPIPKQIADKISVQVLRKI